MPSRFPLLPDHEVLAEIGQGTLGTVFKAINHRTREMVALKRIPAADAALRARLLRDFRAAALLDHPSIVRVHELHQRDEVYADDEPRGLHQSLPVASMYPAPRIVLSTLGRRGSSPSFCRKREMCPSIERSNTASASRLAMASS